MSRVHLLSQVLLWVVRWAPIILVKPILNIGLPSQSMCKSGRRLSLVFPGPAASAVRPWNLIIRPVVLVSCALRYDYCNYAPALNPNLSIISTVA